MPKPSEAHQIIRGGTLFDEHFRNAAPADILLRGDIIVEIGRPGMQAPAGAGEIDASGRLLMPGLVNAHTHGHGSLGKGLGDKWSLELLLNASPWVSGGGSAKMFVEYRAATNDLMRFAVLRHVLEPLPPHGSPCAGR